MANIKLYDEEIKTIQEHLLRINEILIQATERNEQKRKQNSYYSDSGFYYCGNDDEDMEEEAEYFNRFSKEAFFNVVKKILINTTKPKGKIVYKNYEIGYRKIECSSIFEIVDIKTNEVIGEYYRTKNELILY